MIELKWQIIEVMVALIGPIFICVLNNGLKKILPLGKKIKRNCLTFSQFIIFVLTMECICLSQQQNEF